MATLRRPENEVFVLEITRREANALCELLLVADFDGEGDLLDDIYQLLVDAGLETDACSYKIIDDKVVIRRRQ